MTCSGFWRWRIDGGWGVDALLGSQAGEHGDLDIALEARHLTAVLKALSGHGFIAVGEDGATAWNFLMHHPAGGGRRSARHRCRCGRQRRARTPAIRQRLPGRLADRSRHDRGRLVDCITAQCAVRFRDAYTGDADDRADVLALCHRFDLPIPAQYGI